MLQVNNVSLRFGKRVLFEDVNIKFTDGNCYGLIGANGAGKSTFLKILSKEIETTTGEVILGKGERLSFLKQDHYMYDEESVINTVIMGNDRLWKIMEEKNKLYSQTEFSDEDGMRLAELEGEFMDLNGWEAESDAATILNSLGVKEGYHYMLMKEIPVKLRVKVLLAQALFGNPDVLLLDEPTNSLDVEAISWLEEFLINFNNTVIVVSHDRHFLNKVCTHIADLDYNKIKLYIGNYDFWYESSQLALKQMKEANKKKEDKIKELQDFIARFSANASKSKQATSRKKMLEKIQLDEIVPSSRKYPFIDFKIEKPVGKEILKVTNLTKEVDGKKILNKVSFTVLKGDKINIVADDDLPKTALFNIIMGIDREYKGSYEWGKTIVPSYLPQDNSAYFKDNNKLIEAQRIEERTNFDIEMMRETGFCQGIENYSRHISGREPGSAPYTLFDYFPKDFLLLIDESHATIPQVRAMYNGDRARKESLVNYGFRLPSAFDNRPLKFEEFEQRINQVVFVSATPAEYEKEHSKENVVEQIIRPTGLLDPKIDVKPVSNQIDDLIEQIHERVEKHERVLVTTLTKKMAEDLTAYLASLDIKVKYMHSDIKALERMEIIRDLRLGEFDVLVGINLLREGLDIPEVSLVTILDADKEGFLRSERSLIQTIGRAARNTDGKVIMYADELTDSMEKAISETNRRRKIQMQYNEEHGITPQTIQKSIRDTIKASYVADIQEEYKLDKEANVQDIINKLTDEMLKYAAEMEFEKAAEIRDKIKELEKMI